MTAWRDDAGISVDVESDGAGWSDFVGRHPDATGCHDWNWRRVLTGAFGQEVIYLAARRDGRIVGVLPMALLDSWISGRSLVSLPYLNYGGIVADDAEAARALAGAAARVAEERHCSHVELRHTRPQLSGQPCKQHKVAMLLDLLPAADAMWEALDRKVRNQIRKAAKSGLTRQDGGAELLEDFYRVFATNMRDLGTPVYGRGLFSEILAAFPERARVHVVRVGSEAVAAGITFRTGNRVEVPSASSLRAYNSTCPNHLLYWGIIERAIADGCTVLDFGRSTPGHGTFKFKEQWGAEPLPLYWEYQLLDRASMPDTSPSNPKFQAAIEVWKRCPLWITNRVGPVIARSLP